MQSGTGLGGLPTVVTLIIALSIATERLVEIVKGWFPLLDQPRDLPKNEGRRKAFLQLMAVAGGIGVSLLAWPIASNVLPSGTGNERPLTVVALGLLASGGSGFWNSILTYVLSIKDLKSADAKLAKQVAAGAQPLPSPTDGALRG